MYSIVMCSVEVDASIDVLKCIEHAYQVIANRTGQMVNGNFIKD
jgi:hypothetical protein